MNLSHLALAATAMLTTTAAMADIVTDTSLQKINGQYGTSTAVTTTDATGTRTTVTGPGPNAGTNRAQGKTVSDQWYQANVGAGTTVGITTDYGRSGNGSALFSATRDQTGKGDLLYNFSSSRVALSTLSSISYDFYRDGASTGDANYSPVLRLGMFKDNVYAGLLVLENVYQQQQPSPVNTWTTLTANLNNGIFWATSPLLGPSGASANGGQKTLAQWIAGNSGSTLSVYGLEIGVGSGWTGTFVGAVDNVNVAFANGPSVSSNFEVAQATAAVPEPATWAMMIAGFGLVGGALRRRRTAVTFA